MTRRIPSMAHFVFRSIWRLDASTDTVYDALADVERYPTWWKQVRDGRRLDERSGEIVCRSLLPYDLRFVATREIEDPLAHVLRATLQGDLNGISQWTITESGGLTIAVFDEDVEIGTGLLRAAGLAARPVLKANHDLMMRSGERGLRRHLGARRQLSRRGRDDRVGLDE